MANTYELTMNMSDGTKRTAQFTVPTPTAEEVGARPDTWTPTASEVGARPSDWMPTAAQVGAVPTSRTVNGKALSSDITLSASDVGARDDEWLPTPEEIGAALTGYGLGTGGVYPSSLGLTGCAIARGGFYRWDTKTEDTPFANGAMLVIPRSKDSAAFQIACCASGTDKGTIAVRVYSASAASEWEYINPPMKNGVEYRTTKRVEGSVVYTKRINFGAMPNATSRRVQIPNYTDAYTMQSIEFIMRHSSTDSAMQLSYNADPGFFIEESSASVINVVVNTTGDYSAYNGYVTIEYTK